ncbi:hypothetical protein RHGRI_017798 [Rhododendron griersonianum]|uniref:Uncharacterized protein n=1 Tax=Rhododendron griersonianum TaxID=479676 RepID=A0AAV6JZ75_9ERIC|nr:hypothetical protein RHGRI_017798 [Rhododendron griersonianum]
MSLADLTAIPDCRILAPRRIVDQSEQERSLWIFNFFVGCTFHWCFVAVLTLVEVYSGFLLYLMPGCSLEDCLRKFFLAERLENYSCCHCWHGAAAIMYLSSMDENEENSPPPDPNTE